MNTKFDMDSLVNFDQSCLNAKSNVQPMNVSLDFDYKVSFYALIRPNRFTIVAFVNTQFYHPLCNEWIEDSYSPGLLSWKLNDEYRANWFKETCVR